VVFLGGIAIVLCYPFFRTPRLRRELSAIHTVSKKERFPTPPSRSVLLFSITWLLVGSAISVFFDVLDLVPRFVFRRRDIESVLFVKQISAATDGGKTIQILYGGVMLGLLLVLLWNVSAADRE